MDKKFTLASAALPPSSDKAVRFPARPELGTVGERVQVQPNHFLVEVAETDLHHYDVSIKPEVPWKKRIDIINELVKMYAESPMGKRIPAAYDGWKSIYTACPLPFTSREFTVKLTDREGRAGPAAKREFKVSVKLANKPDLYQLQQFLGRNLHETPQETLQVLDVMLRATPSEKHCVVGRPFLDPDLCSGLEYWRGFYQSLRLTQFGLSVNIDISARAFYEPILVTEFVRKHFGHNDLSRGFSVLDWFKLKKLLKGVTVTLSYGGGRTYRITGVSLQPLSKLTFSWKDKQTKVFVVQYYCEKYGIKLTQLALPALQSGNDSRPVYLPMELCLIVPGPMEREYYVQQCNNYNEECLVSAEFGTQVKKQMALVDTRVSPYPMLQLTNHQSVHAPKMGAWNMIKKVKGTEIGAMLYEYGIVAWTDSRYEMVHTLYNTKSYGDGKRKYFTISDKYKLFFLWCGSLPNNTDLSKSLTDHVQYLDANGKLVNLDVVIKFGKWLLDDFRARANEEELKISYGGIFIGADKNMRYQGCRLLYCSGTVEEPEYLNNDHRPRLIAGSGSKYAEGVLEEGNYDPSMSEEVMKKGAIRSSYYSALCVPSVGGFTEVFVFRHDQDFKLNSVERYCPLQLQACYSQHWQNILLVRISKSYVHYKSDFEKHMADRSDVLCCSLLISSSKFPVNFYRIYETDLNTLSAVYEMLTKVVEPSSSQKHVPVVEDVETEIISLHMKGPISPSLCKEGDLILSQSKMPPTSGPFKKGRYFMDNHYLDLSVSYCTQEALQFISEECGVECDFGLKY